MSDLLQPGQHPDADQLNAFVEHALPAHEREQTLAHLAGCAQCREIVSLSLPPFEEAPLIQAQPIEAPPAQTSWFGGWLSGWRLAWIAAPVFAALFALAIYLQNGSRDRRPISPPSQVAEVHPPSPPSTSHSSNESPLSNKSAASTPLSVRPHKPIAPRPESGANTLTLNGRETAVLNSPSQFGNATGVSGSESMAAGGMMGGIASAKSPPPAQLTLDTSSQATGGPITRQTSQPSSLPLIASSSPSPAPSAASVPGSAKPSAVAVANENALLSGQAHGVVTHAAVVRSGLVPTLAPLPSGQPILSFAASLNKLLVLDTQHTLFYSQDDGRHWKQVAPAWKGHAIEVARVAQPGSLTPAAKSFALGVPERFKAGAAVSAQLSANPDSFGSSLSGTVVDPSGAIVAGATVTVQDNRYGVSRIEKSDDAGHYLFSDLAPGSYRIDVQAAGFQKQSLVENLVPSQQAVRNVVLSVGQVSQTVTVDAASVQLETQSRTESIAADRKESVATGPSAKQQTALFVITTESGDRWTSADGLTWTHE